VSNRIGLFLISRFTFAVLLKKVRLNCYNIRAVDLSTLNKKIVPSETLA